MPDAALRDSADDQLLRQLSLYGPKSFYLSGEDHLRLSSFGSSTGGQVVLTGRFLTTGGEIVTFRHQLAAAADRTETTLDVGLGQGWLMHLHVAVDESTSVIRRGQIFVRVQVIRGLRGATLVVGTLAQGYPGENDPLVYPGSRILAAAQRPGVLTSVTGTDPAVNVEISETIPTNARRRLLGVTFTLVTDANAANREVELLIDDGTTTLFGIPVGTAQIASLTRVYSFFAGAERNTIAQATTFNAPLPGVELAAGFRIRTVTTNFQATDNYGAPQLYFEELIEE